MERWRAYDVYAHFERNSREGTLPPQDRNTKIIWVIIRILKRSIHFRTEYYRLPITWYQARSLVTYQIPAINFVPSTRYYTRIKHQVSTISFKVSGLFVRGIFFFQVANRVLVTFKLSLPLKATKQLQAGSALFRNESVFQDSCKCLDQAKLDHAEPRFS